MVGIEESKLITIEMDEHRNEGCSLVAVVKCVIATETVSKSGSVADWIRILQDGTNAGALPSDSRFQQRGTPYSRRHDRVRRILKVVDEHLMDF